MRTFIVILLAIFAMGLVISGCGSDSTGSGSAILAVGVSQGGQAAKLMAADSIHMNTTRIVLGSIKFVNSASDSFLFKSDEATVVTLSDSTVHEIGSISVPAGTYSGTHFKLQRILPTDSSLYATYPELQDKSIWCEGYVNGNTDSTFEWTSDMTANQNSDFTPITLEAGDSVHITFVFDTGEWFVNDSGSYYDPRATLTAAVNSAIEINIGESFRVDQD